MPIVRPIADGTRTGWYADTDAGETGGTLYTQVDEAVLDSAFATTFLRSAKDPPGMIGAAVLGAPHKVGRSLAQTTSTGRAYHRFGCHVGTTHDHYDYVLMFVPDSVIAAPTNPVPAVIHCHGATAIEVQYSLSGEAMESWVDQGWIAVSMRQGTTVHDDGSDDNDGKYAIQLARDGYRATWGWLKRLPWNVSSILLSGYSAGGNSCLNFLYEAARAPACPVPIKGAYLMNPLTNLRWAFGNTTAAGIHGAIKTAYAIPNGDTTDRTGATPAWISLVDTPDGGHDPGVFPLANLTSVPIRMKASYNDTTVRREDNSDQFDARLTAFGWPHQHQVDTHNGNHGDGLVLSEVSSFFIACLAGGI